MFLKLCKTFNNHFLGHLKFLCMVTELVMDQEVFQKIIIIDIHHTQEFRIIHQGKFSTIFIVINYHTL